MPYNIIIDHTTTDRGDHSSRSSSYDDDGDSSRGTGVHLSHPQSPHSQRSAVESHDPNEEGSWLVYHNEIGPSDSASRPHTSNHERPIVEAPQPEEATRRASYRRRLAHPRDRNPLPRARRSSPPPESESVDSHEEWQGYRQGPHPHYARQYAPYPAAYAPSHGPPFPHQSLVPMSQQQHVVPYGMSQYPHASSVQNSPFFPHQPHHVSPPMVGSPASNTYGGSSGYYPFPPQGYPMSPQLHPHPHMAAFAHPVYSTPPVNTPPPSSDTSTSKDDEKFARLEKLLIEQREQQAAKEAAAEQAAKDKVAQEEASAQRAAEIKAASDSAAAAAKAEAEKEHKAAEDKKAAEAAEAADAAAAAAAAASPPKEKEKPIKFKDAVGRKFSFPFHLCATWSGMEFLIKEAFIHIEGIGPHVADGHYDLLGPHGEIILPHVWETVIEPDWTITMHMWPMPEPKEEDQVVEEVAPVQVIEEGLPPPPPPAPSAPKGTILNGKKEKKKQPPPGLFSMWASGKKTKKATKSKKK